MATDERDMKRDVICQEDVDKHRIDKLCREIAERHHLEQWSGECQNGRLVDVLKLQPETLVALRELYDKAYDKGHDAGAREQRKKDANVAETLDHRGCVLLAECHNAIAAAIRAGRE